MEGDQQQLVLTAYIQDLCIYNFNCTYFKLVNIRKTHKMRIMIIKRLFTSGYKNLKNCTISPTGIHALTGCNGSGKSNFLEVPEFVASLFSESDEQRERLLKGHSPLGGEWFPFVNNKEEINPFVFELSASINVQGIEWDIDYSLEIEIPNFVSTYEYEGTAKISAEKIKIKQSSKPGQMKTILTRDDNITLVLFENSRRKLEFKTKSDMSSLQVIEVRQADDYEINFPVLSEFHKAFLAINLLKLNPDKLISASNRQSSAAFQSKPGSTIDFLPFHSLLQEIKKDLDLWKRLLVWLKRLCNIDDISFELEATGEDSSNKIGKYVFIHQQDRVLFPGELSTGCAMLLGLLIAAHSFLPMSGSVILEEPETYLHPKAIIDLITLLREISETNSVIFSTHSPVALNSMHPNEVTVMEVLPNGFVTTRNVSEIREAIETLNRGYISFGDLLQSNFCIDNVFKK